MVEITPDLRSIVDHDGAVIMDIPNNAISTLNSTGAYIWDRLQRGLLLKDIVSELARDTGTDETIVANDIDEFMQQLKSRQLVSFT